MGAKNNELTTKLERLNGTKCGYFSQKWTRTEVRKLAKYGKKPDKTPIFPLEGGGGLGMFCKIFVRK